MYVNKWMPFQSLKSDKRSNPNASLDCKTPNVIYWLKCPTRWEHYIKQTNKLNARVSVHNQQRLDPSVNNTLYVLKYLYNQGDFAPFFFCKQASSFLNINNSLLRLKIVIYSSYKTQEKHICFVVNTLPIVVAVILRYFHFTKCGTKIKLQVKLRRIIL